MKTTIGFISRTFVSRHERALLGLCMAFTLAVSAVSSHAYETYWLGWNPTSGNWSAPDNWTNHVPLAGDPVIFLAGTPRPMNTNNLTGLVLSQIQFQGSNYVIRGNTFILTNSLVSTNLAGTNLLYPAIWLDTADIAMNVGAGASLILGGPLDGDVGVTKTGGGILTYQGAGDNFYSGTTRVNAGQLQLNVGAFNAYSGPLVIGDGSGTGSPVVRLLQSEEIPENQPLTINSGSLLDLNNFNETIGSNLTLNDSAQVQTGSGILTLANNSTITINSAGSAKVYGHLNIGSSGTCTNNAMSGYAWIYADISGAAGLANEGPDPDGGLVLVASNSFTGPLTIDHGTIWLWNSWGCGATNGTVTLNSDARLAIHGSINVTNKALAVNSSNYEALRVYDGTNSWAGNITLGAQAGAATDANCALSLIGPIGGTGGLTKTGPGTLTYLGKTANTYSGPTLVNEGTLELAKTLNRVAIPGGLVVGDGVGGANADIVRLLGHDAILNSADVTINSSGLLDMNGLHDQVNALTGDGNLDLNGGYLIAGTSGGSFTYGGVASGGVGSILWKVGAGTWTLTGNNTHSGQTYIGEGTVLVNGTQPQSPVDFGSTSATLGGTGVVGNVTVTGHLRPGAWNGPTPGLLTCSNLTFTSTGNYYVDLFGTTPGTGYDQVKVRGTVNLANATLHATLGFPAATLYNFTIIDNDGSEAVTNTFAGLPEGATLNVNGTPFTITYKGGSGNDVVIAPQTAMQRPRLRIALVNRTNVVVWWPTNFTGYTLEAGVDAARAAWWAVTPAPVVIGTNNYVTNNLGGAQKYYRLAGPGNLPSGMALIPAGSFTMGDTFSEGDADERPTHTVYVSAFYMDRNEVCKALWEEVYQWAVAHGYDFDNPGAGKAASHPVQRVNWYDIVKWCNARSQKEGRTPAYYTEPGRTVVYRNGWTNVENGWVKWNAGYRLPTEAEWEKAARGGASGHRFPWSDTDNITHSRANYQSSASYPYDTSPTRGYHPAYNDGVYPFTSPVGVFAPNGYGLHDMAGNVWEWCWDWYGSYPSSSPSDPPGPPPGSSRVLRGGDWGSSADSCRSASRGFRDPAYSYYGIGFRVVLAPGQP